ncbi:MAG: hypothetical protein LQ338_000284 [Usnochroma carphineum]|nr:MAG: hypothetical protein LQ338_000284 [Usnochroma carphineum]
MPFSSILALNVRTEIAFGMFSDGCTALSWTNGDTSILAQNWDWQEEQKHNLVLLHVEQGCKPNIEMVTEAGIIGKIGLNSAGVGVCLNAIRAKGVDFGKVPCHLALRRCLDSSSRDEAVTALRRAGIASACHILVADPRSGSGLECSHADVVELPMSPGGLVVHTNHFIKEHPGVEENIQMEDTEARLTRISKLANIAEADIGSVQKMLEDEDGYPTAINRQRTQDSSTATLFSIVMDLGARSASVRIGRPSSAAQGLTLQPNALVHECA